MDPHCSPGMVGGRSPAQGSPALYHEMQPAHYLQQQGPPNNGMAAQSAISVQTNYNPSSQFKVNMWQNRPFDSGVQSMQHSQAASIMSLHAGSQMSAMSMMDNAELTDQQQQKFDNISVSFCPSQAEYGSAVRAIPELLNLIRDDDEVVVFKALGIMQNIAKMDSDAHSQKAVIGAPDAVHALAIILREKQDHPNIIRMALGTLFHICGRAEGLDLVFHVIQATNGDLVRFLVHHVRTIQCSVHKYALLTLHSILSDRQRASHSIALAREMGALEAIGGWLKQERSAKLLSVVVDLVRIMCDKAPEQKAIFVNMDGAASLLHIVQHFTYENLLWRTTQLLKVFSNTNPQALVSCGVPLTMAHQLAHPSDRLVFASLECLRNLSDVRPNENQAELLSCLMKLFGNTNLTVILYTVQILVNLSANNRINKEFLVRHNAVPYLLRVLSEHPVGPHLTDKENKNMEELHETILRTLRGLCFGHPLANDVQVAAFRRPDLFLDKLISMRPLILKQTLQLLSRVAVQDANLPAFREMRLPRDPGTFIGFPEQIVYILRVACNQLCTRVEIEDVKVADLVTSCMVTLQALCRDNSGLLERIATCILDPSNCRVNGTAALLPLFVLQQSTIDDDSLRKCALSFLAALVASPQVANLFAKTPQLMSALQHFARSGNREFSILAEKACRTVMLGGAAPMNPYPSYPEKYQGNSYPPSSSSGVPTPNMSRAPPSPVAGVSSQVEPAEDQPMDGAGEQWPEDLSNLAIPEYPFVNVFCPTESQQNSPPYNAPQECPNSEDVQMRSPQNWPPTNPMGGPPPMGPAHHTTPQYPGHPNPMGNPYPPQWQDGGQMYPGGTAQAPYYPPNYYPPPEQMQYGGYPYPRYDQYGQGQSRYK